MKRTLSILLALCVLCALGVGTAEITREYNYYLNMSQYGYRLYIDSSWEKLALNGSVIPVIDNTSYERGSVLFTYMSGEKDNSKIELFRVDSRGVDSAPPEQAPAYSKQNDTWIIELYVLAQMSGGEYDAVLASLVNFDEIIELIDPSAYWNFTCVDVDGGEHTGDELHASKITMVNIWATYCQPCIVEMPHLGELARKYAPNGFTIVGIITDVYSPDGAQKAKTIIEDTQADYLHVIANEQMALLLSEVEYVPTTYFVDENGVILGTYIGSMSKDEWENIIFSYLN